MRFWDTSALLPLFIVEEKSSAVRPLLNDDPDVLVWALTPVELVSAIWRRVPAEHDSRQRQAAAEIVMAAQSSWIKVRTYEEVAALAYEVCEKHRLRAGDALQLAAALYTWADPSSRPFVTLDHDLASAARAEGFPVLP
ncbi:MAG TPA: type II toxin-antitoxin system VapC family toxin [Thermoanaerobaculia bacterium]|nr:type II toxin-antitoxin system VapC family toxin [Thermoanaerobaculia bacterium]